MSPQNVRVRFAPSPTGPLHMGGVRTALFNYLFAKKNNGTFILRIEDTDQTRYVEGAEEYIMESLEWCGLKFDEGIREGGSYGPYRQSERKDIYANYAQQLIQEGKAYYAFDTPEELDKLRAESEDKGKTFSYDQHTRYQMNNSLNKPDDQVAGLLKEGTPFVIRFKTPENETLEMQDIIRGKVTVNTATLDDKVLVKADGLPTYHLANIVDDHLMEISHVIRGEEWLPSMPLHVLLYQAFGWDAPQFAHLPLILKPTGKGKLSKRDGDKMGFPVFPIEWKPKSGEHAMGYREEGYFPEAFINMLALLGWNPGTEQELFSMDELSEVFSLERVGKAGARFDPEKTKWFNHQYLKEKSAAELTEGFIPVLSEKGIEAGKYDVEKIVDLVKERAVFIHDLWEQSWFFFQAPEEYDAKIVKKRWKEDTPALLQEVLNIIKKAEPFSSATVEESVKQWLESKELGFGAVMNPLRLTIVGGGYGPHLFDIMEIIGKEETEKRISKALETIKK
ncbi:MAG: glutamate--tRNA ligase [Bacteroidota bacterium]